MSEWSALHALKKKKKEYLKVLSVNYIEKDFNFLDFFPLRNSKNDCWRVHFVCKSAEISEIPRIEGQQRNHLLPFLVDWLYCSFPFLLVNKKSFRNKGWREEYENFLYFFVQFLASFLRVMMGKKVFCCRLIFHYKFERLELLIK